MKTWTIRTLEELAIVAKEVLEMPFEGKGARILALQGDLGAGKTAFTQALGTLFGITERMTSPTFTLMRTYDLNQGRFTKLVHIDAYRVEQEEEIEVLRIPELFTKSDTFICIEWPERLPTLLPEDAEKLMFSINEDGTRTITYHG